LNLCLGEVIINNINNSISINGFIGDYFDYNQTYRIDAVNNSKRIVISSYAPVSGASTIIIPQNAFGRINGNIVNVNSLVYDNFAGISTLTTSDPHGLKTNTRIKLQHKEEGLIPPIQLNHHRAVWFWRRCCNLGHNSERSETYTRRSIS
jgi:hypothetical protein